jgi:RNA polymerase sigma factor (sigma-70 family)
MAGPFDLVLLESARGGDREAILSLLALAQPDIRRYARKSCRLSMDADEAVQETLLLVYRRVGTLRALTSFSGWLLAIVRRECLRLARLSFGRVDIDTIAEQDRFAQAPIQELSLDVSQAIQSLPDSYREVVLLRDIEELTIDGISARLSLSREAVKARLHRARKLMREYLTD